jgi:hypothetical protein
MQASKNIGVILIGFFIHVYSLLLVLSNFFLCVVPRKSRRVSFSLPPPRRPLGLRLQNRTANEHCSCAFCSSTLSHRSLMTSWVWIAPLFFRPPMFHWAARRLPTRCPQHRIHTTIPFVFSFYGSGKRLPTLVQKN